MISDRLRKSIGSGLVRSVRATLRLGGDRLYRRASRVIDQAIWRDRAGSDAIQTVEFGNGVCARFYAPGPIAWKRATKALTKDPEMIRWLEQIGRKDVLWDIGANIGIYSIDAGLKRGCRVLAFEPGAANYHLLNQAIQLNALHDRVSAFCIAVAQSTRLDHLHMPDTRPGNALSSFGKPPARYKPERYFRQGIAGFSLDDLSRQLPAPTHIKIDVDGIEPEIIAGGPQMLKSQALRSVIVELDPARWDLLASVVAVMAGHGLAYSHSYEQQWDHIFVRGGET